MASPQAGQAEAQANPSVREHEINKLYRVVMKHEGSDLHLKVGLPPMMRLKGIVRRMEMRPLTQEDMERLTYPTLDARQRRILEESGGVDYSHQVAASAGVDETRFRVNLFKQRGRLSLVARRVSTKIPSFEKLNLPPSIEKLCHFDQGLIILAGITGSGKSTTIASMLDYINSKEHVHILTIEDPIEFTFSDNKAVINQREVGIDVSDWKTALKHAVRQDPDIILVGEMRDRETFEAGIHAAGAASTISRILDLFPGDLHNAIRQALAFNLKAVICQKLVPSIKPGVQRVPTNEIMTINPTIRELIVKGEDKKLYDAIRIGFSEGMLDFTESLRLLVEKNEISKETALEVAPNPEQLKMALKGIKVSAPGIL